MFRMLYQMKAVRLPAIITLSICSLIFLTWELPSGSFQATTKIEIFLQNSRLGLMSSIDRDVLPRRLVVFGDSWSDDAYSPLGPPSRPEQLRGVEEQDKVWTEWLCIVVSCQHHDNFARSVTHPWNSTMLGPVVSNELIKHTFQAVKATNVSNATLDQPLNPGPDLKAQVQQWLHSEKRQSEPGLMQVADDRDTTFIVWFSLWDIWYISSLELSVARLAVRNVLDALFQQLDLIASNWVHDLKVILPKAIDVTFLPLWHGTRTGPAGEDRWADDQRKAVLLVDQWNTELNRRARHWKKGELYIYDAHEWLLQQMLNQELLAQRLAGGTALQAHNESWADVRNGCMGSGSSDGRSTVRCQSPRNYLFWDDVNLSPRAMRLIGEAVAADLSSKYAGTWFRPASVELKIASTGSKRHANNT